MRSDMSKVIVERPRVKGRQEKRGRDDQRVKQEPEDAPQRESSARGRKSSPKYLNENLAPLRRFVLKQVGRPWDRVNAEICEHLRLTSAVQLHVMQHLDQFVVKDVEVVDGEPRHRGDGGMIVGGRWREIAWVCPRTGLLRRSPMGGGRRVVPPERDAFTLRDGTRLQRIAGIWYQMILMPMPGSPEERRGKVDLVLGERLDGPDGWWLMHRLKGLYGREGVYAGGKQQLGKRALARLLPKEMR